MLTNAVIEQFNQIARFEFEMAMDNAAANQKYKAFTTILPSTTSKNIYPWLASIPGYREWIGDRVVHRLAARTYELVNKHFEHTMAVDRNHLLDDNIGIYRPAFQMQGALAAEFIGKQIARKLAAGTTDLAWDNQYFFDVDHPVDIDSSGAGVQANLLTGATYDMRTAGNEMSAYLAARTKMRKWKREDGETAGYVGNLIIVGPDLEAAAMRVRAGMVTTVVKNVAGTENVTAVLAPTTLSSAPEVLVMDEIDSSGGVWFLADASKPIKPLIWQTRQDVIFDVLDRRTDENVFSRREIIWGSDFRGAPGFSFPGMLFRMSPS